MDDMTTKVRLDKWLWAARFFKTRRLAKEAIEAGHVLYKGSRAKVSKDVDIGACLTIRQGYDIKVIEVLKLDDKRKSATLAQMLYQETDESLEKRRINAEQRKQLRLNEQSPATKPHKKNRRLITQFKQQNRE